MSLGNDTKNNKMNKTTQVGSKYLFFFLKIPLPQPTGIGSPEGLPRSLISPPGTTSSSALIPSGIRISISRNSALRSMNNAIGRGNQIRFHHKPK